MRLADTGRPEQQHVLAVGDPARRGEVTDLLGIDRRLGVEVEASEFLDGGEVRELQRHVDAAVILARDLAFAQEHQRLPRRQVCACRFVEKVVELIADAGELEPDEHLVEPIRRYFGRFLGARHQKLPPTMASYSASGLSSAGGGGG